MFDRPMHRQVLLLASAQALFQTASVGRPRPRSRRITRSTSRARNKDRTWPLRDWGEAGRYTTVRRRDRVAPILEPASSAKTSPDAGGPSCGEHHCLLSWHQPGRRREARAARQRRGYVTLCAPMLTDDPAGVTFREAVLFLGCCHRLPASFGYSGCLARRKRRRDGASIQSRSPTMSEQHHVGLDVSVKETAICIVDPHGKVVHRATIESHPEAIGRHLIDLGHSYARVSLEAGPLSPWLYAGLVEAGLPAICVETRHTQGIPAPRHRYADTQVVPTRLPQRYIGL